VSVASPVLYSQVVYWKNSHKIGSIILVEKCLYPSVNSIACARENLWDTWQKGESKHLVRPGEYESMNCRSVSSTKFTQPVHSHTGEEETYFLHFPPFTGAGRRSTF